MTETATEAILEMQMTSYANAPAATAAAAGRGAELTRC